uniref:Putative GT4 n=1 Tax=Magnetococcus massalia (strain MO-1) TaxID=451514 RepID=A0A1S7LJE7_MAGMO|nr:Putative GT4 [Candidatus Magnetococcus massalia]
MRIGIVVCQLIGGGLETVLKYLADELMEEGHEVDFIEDSTHGPWSREFCNLGYQVKTFTPGYLTSMQQHALNVARSLGGYDVLLLNEAPVVTSILGLLPESSIRVSIVHLHHPGVYHNAVSNYPKLDHICTVSRPLKQEVLKQNPKLRDHVTTITNGVPVPAQWPCSQKNFYGQNLRVIFLGRLEKQQKGVLHLPGIFDQVWRQYPDVELSIIGDGPDRESLQQQFDKIPHKGKVEYHGFVSHTNALKKLSEGDLLVMPSYFEGMPIALLEAMAQGVVPVATALEGMITPIVNHGHNGLLYPPVDEQGFASGIIELVSDRDRARAMSKAAWQTAHEDYHAHGMAQRYLQVITACRKKRTEGNALFTGVGKLHVETLDAFYKLPRFLVKPAGKLHGVCRRVGKTVGRWLEQLK